MREAIIILLVGLILGTNYVHGAQVRGTKSELGVLIEQSEQMVTTATEHDPAGWAGMNLIAEIQDMQDTLNAALPRATRAEQAQIQAELQRLQGALNLLNGQA